MFRAVFGSKIFRRSFNRRRWRFFFVRNFQACGRRFGRRDGIFRRRRNGLHLLFREFVLDQLVDEVGRIQSALRADEFDRLRRHFGREINGKFRAAGTLDFHGVTVWDSIAQRPARLRAETQAAPDCFARCHRRKENCRRIYDGCCRAIFHRPKK